MGMFDDIEVLYELPRLPAGHDRQFQTKSLECILGNYRIDVDGTLWREEFDIEDRSDPNATCVNQRWVRDTHTGEIQFHDFVDGVRLEYQAWFRDGQLRDIVVGSWHEVKP